MGMAPRLVAVAILDALVRFSGAASDGVSWLDMTDARAKCESLLTGMSVSEYSADELAILCRARLPGPICREAARQLGPTPWSPATVGATCNTWAAQWRARTLGMTAEERVLEANSFQKAVDEIVKKKADVHLCQDLSVDECVSYKKSTVPKYSEEIEDILQEKRAESGEDDVSSKYIATKRLDLAVGVAKVHRLGAAIGFGIVGALVLLFTMWRTRRARSSLSASGAGDDTDVREMLRS